MSILSLPDKLTDIDINPKKYSMTDVINTLIYIKEFLTIDEYSFVLKCEGWLVEKKLKENDYYENIEKYRYEFNGIFERVNKKSYLFWLDFEKKLVEKSSTS